MVLHLYNQDIFLVSLLLLLQIKVVFVVDFLLSALENGVGVDVGVEGTFAELRMNMASFPEMQE